MGTAVDEGMMEILPLVFAVVAQLLTKKSRENRKNSGESGKESKRESDDIAATSRETPGQQQPSPSNLQDVYDWLIKNGLDFHDGIQAFLDENEKATQSKNLLRSLEQALDAIETQESKVRERKK